MAYFAALLARADDDWQASDIDLDQVDDLDGLADLMRESAADDGLVLLLLEQEDVWFAVVRVDGYEDPRVFVSDRAAVAHSAYAEMLLPELVEDLDVDDLDIIAEVAYGADGDDGDDEEEPPPPVGPAGEEELLTDLGVSAEKLGELGNGGASEALTAVAEAVGAGEALELVR